MSDLVVQSEFDLGVNGVRAVVGKLVLFLLTSKAVTTGSFRSSLFQCSCNLIRDHFSNCHRQKIYRVPL